MNDEHGGGSRWAKTILAALILVLVADSARASVEITSDPTKHMRCADGVCSPLGKKANLNVDDLANMLATSDVKVTTGNGAVTITVGSALTWVSASRLTLDANLDVSFRAAVEVAGPGGLTIITNDGRTGGDLLFFEGGVVDFWDPTSSLIINGNSYALIDTLPTLIDAVKANPAGYYALSKSYNAIKTRVYKTSPINIFGGVFEGLGHTISNLAINFSSNKKRRPPIAMFSASSGTIRDIGLVKLSVVSNSFIVGGLVGQNDGKIVGAYVTGAISGQYAGGLAAESDGAVVRSYSLAQVTGTSAGGLVGINSGGTITLCYATGAVGSAQNVRFNVVGGLVAENNNSDNNEFTGTITQSYSTGAVSGTYGGTAGGLVAKNLGVISLSHSDSNMLAGDAGTAGGLVGANGGTISQSYADGALFEGGGGLVGLNGGTILQSYATGSVEASIAGGLVEVNQGPVAQSYSTGSSVAGFGDGYGGGLVGVDQSNSGGFSSTYWDTDTSGVTDLSKGAGNIPYDPGITGLTSAQLSGGLPPGFDPNVWSENAAINSGLPYLLANPPPTGQFKPTKKPHSFATSAQARVGRSKRP